MKTFLQIFISVFISLTLLFLGALLIFSAMFESSPDIPSKAFLEIRLSGDLPEYVAPDQIEEALGRVTLDLRKVRENLEKAAVDERIKYVVLRPEMATVGFAKLQELTALLQNFREKSGKKVYAYLGADFSFTRDYYLACATDSIIMPPDASLFLTGVRSEVTFYKDFFEKIGVQAQFLHVGQYKNAPDAYTRNTMSPYHREVLKNVVDQYFNDIVHTIATTRGLSEEKVKTLINQHSGFTAQEAVDLGLVDGLGFYAELVKNLKKRVKGLRKLTAGTYALEPISSLKIRNKRRIAVINCVGTIYGGSESEDPLLGKLLGAKTIIDNIQRAAKSRSIKAIVLRIDSPGGASLPSAEIWQAIMEAKKKKPVIASVSDLGASGGFFIAMAADTIVAQPNSLVGSIGIFAGKFVFKDTYKKLGFNTQYVQQGRHADLFSFLSPWDREEKAIIQRIIERFYQAFVQKVANARRMEFDQAEKLARGRVWTGAQAFKNGLVDTLGTFYTALQLAKQKANIPPEESVRLVYYPRKKSLLNDLLTDFGVLIQSRQSLLHRQFNQLKSFLTSWQNKPLALMPFRIEFK